MVDWLKKREKVVRSDGVLPPEGHIIDVKDRYKYIGLPQANENQKEVARKAANSKYLQRGKSREVS